jgi:hypothetical protein
MTVTYGHAPFLWFTKLSCLVDSQGTHFFLGTFPDPVSAAMRFDKEAKRVHGRYALLNFPYGTPPLPTFKILQSQSALVPTGGGRGQAPPETEGVLPCGIPQGNPMPAGDTFRMPKDGSPVSLISWQ